MSGAEEQLEALREALERLATADAEELLAEARAEARATLRKALTDTFTRCLGEAIERQLGDDSARAPAPARAKPAAAEAERPTRKPESPSETAPTAIAEGRGTAAEGVYVYGVIWAPDMPLTDDLSGLDADGPVTTLIEGPLAAVVSRVPLAEYEEEVLRGHLSDTDWVERVARAHEAVLDDLCARTVVVPMRMCTVYRSDENLRMMLRREEADLRAALEFLDGKLEWGVKVIAPGEPEGRVADSGTAAGDARAASSGTDYLARRRARRDEQAATETVQAEAAAEIHERLCGLAHEGRLNPTQAPDLPGQDGRMLANGVYLVERELTDSFHEEGRELEERFADLRLELVESGPWPPYNFVPGDVGAAW